MQWVTLLALVFKALAERLGWFGIAAAREYNRSIRPHVGTGDVPESATEAPEELKRVITEFLQGLADKVPGIFPRLMLRQVIAAVPALVDYIWDQLFAEQLVRMPFHQTGMGASLSQEKDIIPVIESSKEPSKSITEAAVNELDQNGGSDVTSTLGSDKIMGGVPATPSTQPEHPFGFSPRPAEASPARDVPEGEKASPRATEEQESASEENAGPPAPVKPAPGKPAPKMPPAQPAPGTPAPAPAPKQPSPKKGK